MRHFGEQHQKTSKRKECRRIQSLSISKTELLTPKGLFFDSQFFVFQREMYTEVKYIIIFFILDNLVKWSTRAFNDNQ